MTLLQQGNCSVWELCSAEWPLKFWGCFPEGCSLIPCGAAGGMGSCTPWWRKEFSASSQRTCGNIVHLRRRWFLFTQRRMSLPPSCMPGEYSPCTLQRPLRSFQCRCCFWEFRVGKYEPLHCLPWMWSVFACLQILGLKQQENKGKILSNDSCIS